MIEPHTQLMFLAPSTWQLVIVVLLVVVLFGKGKISDLMGDFAKGVKSFKKGLSDDEETAKSDPAKAIDNAAAPKADVHTSAGSQTKA
jgi:sec-independent protein translocase protein TatA